jgi:hypothetical protein
MMMHVPRNAGKLAVDYALAIAEQIDIWAPGQSGHAVPTLDRALSADNGRTAKQLRSVVAADAVASSWTGRQTLRPTEAAPNIDLDTRSARG